MGLVHEVVALDTFEARSNELIESFLQAGPQAAKQAKLLIKNIMKLKNNKMKLYTCSEIAQRRASDEGQEGMSALLEKRKPSWAKND